MNSKLQNVCCYPFHGNGKKAVWEITNKCNANCRHCCAKSGSQSKKGLEMGDIKMILDDLSKNNFTEIYFGGGEPFLREDIMEILKESLNKMKRVSINTNGSLITEDMANSQIMKELRYVGISLDSLVPSKHNRFRGMAGSWQKAKKSLEILLDKGVNARVLMTLHKNNYEELEEMIKFCIKRKMDVLMLNIILPVGRAINEKNILFSEKEERKVRKGIKALKEKYSEEIKIGFPRLEDSKNLPLDRCLGGKKLYFINWEGRVGGCPWVCNIETSFLSENSLKDKYFKEILGRRETSKFRQIVEKRFKSNSCKKCTFKNKCGKGCPFMAKIRNNSLEAVDPLCRRRKNEKT